MKWESLRLSAEEDRRRRAAYERTDNDAAAGRTLRLSYTTFQSWRKRAGLPAKHAPVSIILSDVEVRLRLMFLMNPDVPLVKVNSSFNPFARGNKRISTWGLTNGVRANRVHHCTKEARSLALNAYDLRQQGYSDYMIAAKLDLLYGSELENAAVAAGYPKDYTPSDYEWMNSPEVKAVQVMIGEVLMQLCRRSPACPYKALLPESRVGRR